MNLNQKLSEKNIRIVEFDEINNFIGIILLSVISYFIVEIAKKSTNTMYSFKYDSLPIKNMAIDVDLKSGAINWEETTNKRLLLFKKEYFYGN